MEATATNGQDRLMTREETSRWLCAIVGTTGGVGVSQLRALESRGGVSPVILGGPPKYDARARFAALVGCRLLGLGGSEAHLSGLGARLSEMWPEMEAAAVPWNLAIEPGKVTIQSGGSLTVPRGSAAESPVVFVVLACDRLFRRALAA